MFLEINTRTQLMGLTRLTFHCFEQRDGEPHAMPATAATLEVGHASLPCEVLAGPEPWSSCCTGAKAPVPLPGTPQPSLSPRAARGSDTGRRPCTRTRWKTNPHAHRLPRVYPLQCSSTARQVTTNLSCWCMP
jgi:hypothetical protein